MRNCLIIANQFPPMGGSGVQRTSKFVKYLRDFGYNPIVLTRDVGRMPLKDESLLNDIPKQAKVYRTNPKDLTEWRGIFGLVGKVIARKILIPDAEVLWARLSRKKAVEIIKNENINIIYTTSYPYSDHLLGLYIKQSLPHIKWVADFRDEWTNNPYTLDSPHNGFRTKTEKRQELDVLLNADAVIANTPVMRENFIKICPQVKDKICDIPNGYDLDDFLGIEKPTMPNEKLTITYVGSLYGRRKPDPFFEALKQLRDEEKIDCSKLSVRFIGNYKQEQFMEKIKSYGLLDTVSVIGYIPHRECLEKLVESDLLLIIEGTGRGAEAFYTGKIFEYMNSGVPVMALLPDKGVAADLMRKTGIGRTADTDNIPGIKENFLCFYNDWLKGDMSISPDHELIKRFERRELTKELSEIFNSLL